MSRTIDPNQPPDGFGMDEISRAMSCTVSVKWIDALKELPDSDRTVLIHCPISDDPVWIGYYDGKAWRQIDGEILPEDFVDHWSQLPDPPRLPWHVE